MNSENDVHLFKILNLLLTELFGRSFFARHGMRIWSGSNGQKLWCTRTRGEEIIRKKKQGVKIFFEIERGVETFFERNKWGEDCFYSKFDNFISQKKPFLKVKSNMLGQVTRLYSLAYDTYNKYIK